MPPAAAFARMAKPLEPHEEDLARLLARCGLGARAARAYAALARGGGHTASDLAAATGLARQDAGEAARELEAADLARVEKVASGGRPALRYHARRDGLAALVERRRGQIAEELAALDELSRH